MTTKKIQFTFRVNKQMQAEWNWIVPYTKPIVLYVTLYDVKPYNAMAEKSASTALMQSADIQ